jgi:hypothetical protein
MLSFELSAIDLILVIAVILLLILYITKFSAKTIEPKSFRKLTTTDANPEKLELTPQNNYTECPRGFGNIKKLGEDSTVSERCLGCYRIMECYSEKE